MHCSGESVDLGTAVNRASRIEALEKSGIKCVAWHASCVAGERPPLRLFPLRLLLDLTRDHIRKEPNMSVYETKIARLNGAGSPFDDVLGKVTTGGK